MNVKSITPNTGYQRSRIASQRKNNAGECVKERHNLKEIKNDQINTTIGKNSDGRVSFKGGVPFLHKAATFASENPLVAESIFAILVTCGLRPLTIMASAHKQEDKSKCSYQAAKSISSGVVGLATTALIGMPIAKATKHAKENLHAFDIPENIREESTEIVKRGVDVLKEKAKEVPEIAGVNLSKLTNGGKINLSVFKHVGKKAEKSFTQEFTEKMPDVAETVTNAIKQQHVLDNYKNASKNVADKLFQPVFMPIRATITIALVPVILGALGLKKSAKKPKEAQQNQNPFQNISLNVAQKNNDVFKAFAGVMNNENK